MTKKSSIGSKSLSAFRYGVNFGERLFHNTISQVKWVFKQGKWAHKELSNLYLRQFGNAPHPALSIGVGILLVIIGFHLLFFLFLWAILKSI